MKFRVNKCPETLSSAPRNPPVDGDDKNEESGEEDGAAAAAAAGRGCVNEAASLDEELSMNDRPNFTLVSCSSYDGLKVEDNSLGLSAAAESPQSAPAIIIDNPFSIEEPIIGPSKFSRQIKTQQQTRPIGKSSSVPTFTSFQGLLKSIAERGRRFAERQRWRLILKDGTCNVASMHVMERKRKYLVDMFTTVIDMKWRYNLIMFAMTFLVSWTFFAIIWWLIVYTSGDCHPPVNADTIGNDTRSPCIANVYDFTTAMLFSIETQHTIGYGYRVIEPNCVTAIIILMIQSCVGVFIQSLITGIIFSKISRPKGRAQTIMFSRHAVICRREGQHCLLFRVGDMRKSRMIGTSIRVMMVRDKQTSEGECIPLCQSSLKVETEMGGTDTFAFLIWPTTVAHIIDDQSPLWDMSAEQLITEQFEIIVILEGTVESNGKMTQVRTSYLPSEILWGHRLNPLLTYETMKGAYEIDYKQFHSIVPIAMTDLSAHLSSIELEMKADQQQQKRFYHNMEDSSISLCRGGQGRPTVLSTPRRLYRKFTTGLHSPTEDKNVNL